MFSEALKQLIEASLVDGTLAAEERAVILKRAMLEGLDADEANLLLEAELQKVKLQRQAKAPKVSKCPACGEILPALTGVCPSCGTVVDSNANNHELDFLVEQMNRGLAQLKSGTTTAPLVIATLDELRRRTMTLYGDNPKVKMLLEEVKQETDEYKRIEAERQKADDELKRMEAKARIEAAKNAGGNGCGNVLGNRGCQIGCLTAFVIFMIMGFIGMALESRQDERADQQYEKLMKRLDNIKQEPITVENFEQKAYDVKDLIWVVEDKYAEHEKANRKAFEQKTHNYIQQLLDFYSVNAAAITEHYGHPVSLDFQKREISVEDLDDDDVGSDDGGEHSGEGSSGEGGDDESGSSDDLQQ